MTGQALRLVVDLDISPATAHAANLAGRMGISGRLEIPMNSVYKSGPLLLVSAFPGRAYEVRDVDVEKMHLLMVIIDDDAGATGDGGLLEGVKRYQILTEPTSVSYDVNQTSKPFYVTLKDGAEIDYSKFGDGGMFGLPDDLGMNQVNALTISSGRPAASEGTFVVRVVDIGAYTPAEPFLMYCELQETPGDPVLQWEWTSR